MRETAQEKYGEGPYLKHQNKWFDGYKNEKVICLEDMDKGGEVLGHHIKLWADKYAVTGESNGGHLNLNHHTFVVTSNYEPHEIFGDQKILEAVSDRFIVKKFEQKEGIQRRADIKVVDFLDWRDM